jgi:hypothetical protein
MLRIATEPFIVAPLNPALLSATEQYFQTVELPGESPVRLARPDCSKTPRKQKNSVGGAELARLVRA